MVWAPSLLHSLNVSLTTSKIWRGFMNSLGWPRRAFVSLQPEAVLGIHVHDLRSMRPSGRFVHLREGGDDDEITRLNQVSARAVDAYHSGARLARDRVGDQP